MNNNVKAAFLVVLGMMLISSNDAIMKVASEHLGIGQLLFIRGLLAMVIFSAVIKIKGMSLRPSAFITRWNSLRACFECAATLCFITGLSLLPIATTSTLGWTAPIFVTISAAVILKERVTLIRWVSVFVGFLGVLLVTNSFDGEFSNAMILPLLAALFVCFRDIVTQKIDISLHSLYITYVSLVLVTLVGGGIASFHWQPIDLIDIGWLSLSALLLGLGFFAQVTALRLGELSFIAPFSFAGILVSVVYGYLIWDEFPTIMMFAGIGLIIGAGIYAMSSQSSSSQSSSSGPVSPEA
ncbi:MAG: EamA family transporter [Gammaproteobacteria bacterium]|nr:EamA family transporter [Gammaproteobacteria bacterium]